MTGQMQGSEPALHFAVDGDRTSHAAGSAISSKPSKASVTTDSSRTTSRSASALNSLCRRAWVIDSPITCSAFDMYVETQLAPTLLKDDVDILLPAGQHQQAKNNFSQTSLLWSELSSVRIIIHELTRIRQVFRNATRFS
jgi:hypothetical protein